MLCLEGSEGGRIEWSPDSKGTIQRPPSLWLWYFVRHHEIKLGPMLLRLRFPSTTRPWLDHWIVPSGEHPSNWHWRIDRWAGGNWTCAMAIVLSQPVCSCKGTNFRTEVSYSSIHDSRGSLSPESEIRSSFCNRGNSELWKNINEILRCHSSIVRWYPCNGHLMSFFVLARDWCRWNKYRNVRKTPISGSQGNKSCRWRALWFRGEGNYRTVGRGSNLPWRGMGEIKPPSRRGWREGACRFSGLYVVLKLGKKRINVWLARLDLTRERNLDWPSLDVFRMSGQPFMTVIALQNRRGFSVKYSFVKNFCCLKVEINMSEKDKKFRTSLKIISAFGQSFLEIFSSIIAFNLWSSAGIRTLGLPTCLTKPHLAIEVFCR